MPMRTAGSAMADVIGRLNPPAHITAHLAQIQHRQTLEELVCVFCATADLDCPGHDMDEAS